VFSVVIAKSSQQFVVTVALVAKSVLGWAAGGGGTRLHRTGCIDARCGECATVQHWSRHGGGDGRASNETSNTAAGK